MKYARFLVLAVVVLAAACSSETATSPATNPNHPNFSPNPPGTHFQSASADFASATSGDPNGANLDVSFEIAGLGNAASTVHVIVTGHADALYACQNNGGNFPTDPKKKDVASAVKTEDDVTVTNGHASDTFTLVAPASTLRCPGGQHSVLVSITWTDVQVTVGTGPNAETADADNSGRDPSYSKGPFFQF